jgi:hypothetical protein
MRAIALCALFLGPAVLGPSAASQDTRAVPSLEGTALINAMMDQIWKERKVKPAEPAADEAFLRRAALDLAGTVPTADDVRLFLKNPAKDKRARAIDSLLASPEYGEHWSNVWWRIFDNGENPGRFALLREQFRDWLTDQFRANTPWDKLVASMLTVSGSSEENPQMWYLMQNFNVNRREASLEIAGPVTGHFLGIQMACARCHDHKYIKEMTQQRFYEMAAFFNNVAFQPKNYQEIRNNPRAVPIVEATDRRLAARLRLPSPEGEERGPVVSPVFYPDGIKAGSMNTRQAFADLLTKNNLQFARAAVNRVWTALLGHGFVNPGDGFADAQPNHPALLDALARDFVKHGYDLKYLMRSIANSKVYQLSSESGGRKQLDPDDFAVANLRPMAPHQLINALGRVVGYDVTAPGRRGALMGRFAKKKDDPKDADGKKSEQEMMAEMMKRRAQRGLSETFDVNPDDLEGYKVNIQQALVLMNNEQIAGGPLRKIASDAMRKHDAPEERVEQLFLQILSRRPEPAERRTIGAYVKDDKSGDKYEDVAWALLNASEFIFVH